MRRLIVLLLVIAVVFLAATNPTEADFRDHIRIKEGIAGQFGMVVADLLSGGKKGGISRENYIIASRFYVGGDGILPRTDVAWGIGGKFFEIKGEDDEAKTRSRRYTPGAP